MSNTRKLALSVTVLAACAVMLFEIAFPGETPATIPDDNDPRTNVTLGYCAKSILNQQKRTLGLSQSLPMPKVYFGNNVPVFLSGEYDPDTETVRLSSIWLRLPAPDESRLGWLRTLELLNKDARQTLAHELGHYYTDQLNVRITHKHWPKLKGIKDDNKFFGLKIVSEGIAVYFDRAINGGDDNFRDTMYPGMPDWTNFGIYDGGYHLVKPIVDTYGERGIIYLMTHSPEGRDINSLPAYRARALISLSENDE